MIVWNSELGIGNPIRYVAHGRIHEQAALFWSSLWLICHYTSHQLQMRSGNKHVWPDQTVPSLSARFAIQIPPLPLFWKQHIKVQGINEEENLRGRFKRGQIDFFFPSFIFYLFEKRPLQFKCESFVEASCAASDLRPERPSTQQSGKPGGLQASLAPSRGSQTKQHF